MIRHPGLVVLLIRGLLGGCKMEASLAIVPHGTAPGLVVTYDEGEAACVKGIAVTAPVRRDE